ncbi:MAG: NAD(P)-dependent oxidoreductase [Nitrososphaerota archaeon]|nr:NAD(P)-dependent oxidoreductase [Nitrososphaerota archaeon]
MTSALVTGYGFVSRHLVRALSDRGTMVSVLEKDLSRADAPDGVEVIRSDLRYWSGPREPVDYVYHLAGITNTAYAEANPLEAFEANVLATANLLDKCRPKERLVFTSSAVVYASSTKPIPEDAPLGPVSTYGATKQAAEALIAAHARKSSYPAGIARFFNLYGPGQARAYLVPQLIAQAREGQIRIRNPRPRRDYIFIEDAVACLLKLADSEAPVVNVGTGTGTSVGALAAQVAGVFGGVGISTGQEADSFVADSLVADIAKARAMGWEPKISLSEGLRKTMNPALYSKPLPAS